MAIDTRSADGPEPQARHTQARWSRVDSAPLDLLEVRTAHARRWAFAWRGRTVLVPLTDGIAGPHGPIALGSVLVGDVGAAPLEICAPARAAFRVLFEDPEPARAMLRWRVEQPRVCAAEAPGPAALFRAALAAAAEVASVSSRISPALARARRYIEEHLEAQFDLDTLSATVGVDRCHLCRSFGRAFGLSPYRYRAQLRLARARELILAGLTCGEASYAVGFCDQSHLSRLFRESTGTTPGAYARAVARRVPEPKPPAKLAA